MTEVSPPAPRWRELVRQIPLFVLAGTLGALVVLLLLMWWRDTRGGDHLPAGWLKEEDQEQLADLVGAASQRFGPRAVQAHNRPGVLALRQAPGS